MDRMACRVARRSCFRGGGAGGFSGHSPRGNYGGNPRSGDWSGCGCHRDPGERRAGVREKLVGNGVLAIALIRMIPVVPFSFVNLVAGALRVGFAEFLLGTLLGMAPGLITLFALGATASRMLHDPTPSNIALLVLAAAFWLLASASAQYAIKRIGRPQR